MTDKIVRVLIVGADAEYRETVLDILGWDKSIAPAAAKGGLATLRGISAETAPDLVVAHHEEVPGHGLEDVSSFTQRFPDVPLLLVCAKKDPDVMVAGLRAGVRGFLFEPLVAEEVRSSVKRAVAGAAGGVHENAAMVETFIPCKGGSGATFLAANLAYVLAETKRRKVLLLDLNLQFGDAYLFLMDQLPAVTLSDVCASIDRLDVTFLESAAAKVDSGLHVLAAPASPEDGDVVKAGHIVRLIGLARSMYDFVIIDTGRSFDEVALKALDMADHVYPVLQLELPYVRHAKRMKELFSSLGYGPSKVRWVVNRHIGKEDIALADAERLLSDAFWVVPNDHRGVVTSTNQGVPIARSAPHSAVVKSLHELANRLVPEEPAEHRDIFRFFHRSGRQERT